MKAESSIDIKDLISIVVGQVDPEGDCFIDEANPRQWVRLKIAYSFGGWIEVAERMKEGDPEINFSNLGIAAIKDVKFRIDDVLDEIDVGKFCCYDQNYDPDEMGSYDDWDRRDEWARKYRTAFENVRLELARRYLMGYWFINRWKEF